MKFEVYRRFKIFTVSGYLQLLDARIISSILSSQIDKNIFGNLCEIGVHHGRLFFMLALSRRANERSLAIDLFEDDHINSSYLHRGRDRALAANARRLGIPLSEVEIYKTSSLEIIADDILTRIGGPIRFFSVDGGHGFENIRHDLALAETALSDEGVIAVDDFFNVEWPEVTFAAYNLIRASDKIIPFLLTPGKIYLTRPSVAPIYRSAIGKANPNVSCARVQFFNHEVYLMRYGLPRWALGRMYDAGVAHVARLFYADR